MKIFKFHYVKSQAKLQFEYCLNNSKKVNINGI